MHKHSIPPISSLDFDPFVISDAMLGPATHGDFSLPHSEPLFALPALAAPLSLHDGALSVNGFRSMSNGSGSSSQTVGLLQPHLDLAVASEAQPLPTRSFSRSLPEIGVSRSAIEEQPTSPKRPHNHTLSNKEIVREQNRRAAARFRQRQKVGFKGSHANTRCFSQLLARSWWASTRADPQWSSVHKNAFGQGG